MTNITGIDNSHDCINCRQNQILSFLELEGFPADMLLYNIFLNTRSVYDDIFIKKLPRWLVNNIFVDEKDLGLFGVTLTDTVWTDVKEIGRMIPEQIDSGKCLFIPANCFHLPHHPIYQKTNFPHSLVVTKYESVKDALRLHIADDVTHDFRMYEYNFDELEAAFMMFGHPEQGVFTRLPEPNTVTTYEYTPLPGERLQEVSDDIHKRFLIFVEHYQEDFYLYDSVQDLLNGTHNDHFLDVNEMIEYLIHAFSALKGSRHLFARYLSSTKDDQGVIEQLTKCEKTLELIRVLLLRFQMTGKVNVTSIADKCMDLKKTETELMCKLKARAERVMR